MLENIEIIEYKCFKNFKLNGLSRLNIINGKNNVGKTALLEALYLITSYFNDKTYRDTEKREKLHFGIIESLINIEKNRQGLEMLSEWSLEEFRLILDDFEISSGKKLLLNDDNIIYPNEDSWNNGTIELSKFRDNKDYYKLYKKNNLPIIDDYRFISHCASQYGSLPILFDKIIDENKDEELFKILEKIFNITDVRITSDKKLKVKQDGKFRYLHEFGNGLKHFINIILTILSHKNEIIFIDELENGLHYSKLKDIAKAIIEIAQKEYIQVFITTHDKETIEAFMEACEEVDFKDITSIELYKDKETNVINPIVMNYDNIIYGLEMGEDFR